MTTASQILTAVRDRIRLCVPLRDPQVRYLPLVDKSVAVSDRLFTVVAHGVNHSPSAPEGRPYSMDVTVRVRYRDTTRDAERNGAMADDAEYLVGLLMYTPGDEWMRTIGADAEVMGAEIENDAVVIRLRIIW